MPDHLFNEFLLKSSMILILVQNPRRPDPDVLKSRIQTRTKIFYIWNIVFNRSNPNNFWPQAKFGTK
jgi:hypothetical protein